MIDFPANPTVGQQFTSGGVTWTWDGTKWTAGGQSVAYLPLAGGTMLGPIVLAADPAAALQPATKQYVDGGRLGDNRLINGDMRIDQRNNGASGTAIGYTIDRWRYDGSQTGKGTWIRGTSGPATFPYCLLFTSSSAYASLATDYFQLNQYIEADMVSDFAWGTASAQPVTLSFSALSSLTGTFSGSITNAASNRSYAFTFSLPTVNTWTRIVINIPGDPGGTWVLSGNAASVVVHFDLGTGANYRGTAGSWQNANLAGVTGSVSTVATNGANFAVTGVKLEIGSVATPFNRQSLAKSLADCQRYYNGNTTTTPYAIGGAAVSGQTAYVPLPFSVPMRIAPTVVANAFGGSGYSAVGAATITTAGFSASITLNAANFVLNYFWTASAEL